MNVNTKVIRGGRKLEKPRPLRINSDPSQILPLSPTVTESLSFRKPLNEIMNDLENLHISISNDSYSSDTVNDIIKMSDIFKANGLELDATFRERLDRYFATLRNVSRENHIDQLTRVRLLELIELRAMGWRPDDCCRDYYQKKIADLEALEKNIPPPILPPIMPLIPVQPPVLLPSSPALEPGEFLRSSGKFARPTKIAGKQYYKDEIVIRNSDSGKVMGIKGRRVHMIEELSDTIISFQRVNPGARDRLVQITGPSEDRISHAKVLVEDTIRRNASPIREKGDSNMENEMNENIPYGNSYDNLETSNFMYRNQLTHSLSMTDASVGEYSFIVNVGNTTVKVSGDDHSILKTAKLVLEQYFAGVSDLDEKCYDVPISPPVHSAGDCTLQRTNLNRLPTFKKSELQMMQSNYIEAEEKSSISSICSEDDPQAELLVKNDINRSYVQRLSAEMSSSTFRTELDQSPSPQNNRVIDQENKPVQYHREYLLNCANSPFSKDEPNNMSEIRIKCPLIVREPSEMFDSQEYIEIWKNQISSYSHEEET